MEKKFELNFITRDKDFLVMRFDVEINRTEIIDTDVYSLLDDISKSYNESIYSVGVITSIDFNLFKKTDSSLIEIEINFNSNQEYYTISRYNLFVNLIRPCFEKFFGHKVEATNEYSLMERITYLESILGIKNEENKEKRGVPEKFRFLSGFHGSSPKKG